MKNVVVIVIMMRLVIMRKVMCLMWMFSEGCEGVVDFGELVIIVENFFG